LLVENVIIPLHNEIVILRINPYQTNE
jgi:hypothetical protein